jgi:hypothetical protein
MTELLETGNLARELSSAFVADIDNAPALKDAIARGAIGPARLHQMLSKDIRSNSPLFPRLGKVVRAQATLQAGMGQDWVGSLSQALVGVSLAAVTYLSGKKVVESEKEKAAAVTSAVAAAQTTAAQQAQLEAAKAKVGQSGSISDVLTSTVAGVPVWVIPAGLAAIIAGYLALRR